MTEPTVYPISDLRIRVAVQDVLQTDPDLDATDIQVDVDHGEVRLSGAALSPADAADSVAQVAAVEGVTVVHNDLI